MTHREDNRSIDDRERYVGYATHCLQLAKVATDRISRCPQGDGCGVAEVGGSIRRLSSERLRQMPRHDFRNSPLVRFGAVQGAVSGPGRAGTNPRAGRPNTPVGFSATWNNGSTETFAPYAKRSASLILAIVMTSSAATAQAPPTPVTPPAQTAPPAPARNATGCAPTQSMPQQGTIAPQGTHSHRSARRAARRQVGEIRRSALPAHRS